MFYCLSEQVLEVYPHDGVGTTYQWLFQEWCYFTAGVQVEMPDLIILGFIDCIHWDNLTVAAIIDVEILHHYESIEGVASSAPISI